MPEIKTKKICKKLALIINYDTILSIFSYSNSKRRMYGKSKEESSESKKSKEGEMSSEDKRGEEVQE